MSSIVVGPGDATCEVFTFKEGVLSPMAHDLRLRVLGFEIGVERDPLAVSARFDAASLSVVGAMRAGRPAPDALAARDKAEIEATIRTAVLDADRHPDIRFVSTAAWREQDHWQVRGVLTLTGTSREILLQPRQVGDLLVTEARLHQPDFGIRPYRAMLGVLRVQPDVIVRLSVPAATVLG